ncbi:MAG: gamma-glutamyltransferase, partial [Pseudomonadota bacterium]
MARGDGMRDFQRPGRSTAYAARAMAATSHQTASAVAIETLHAGGNAVDAGVAAALVLNLCEPHMTSLAGDCFALYVPPGAAPLGMNASGRAPAGLDTDALRNLHGDGPIPPESASSVTIPGAALGLHTLHARHGRLGFDRVAAPAIDAAETGVPIAPRVARDLASASAGLQGPGAEKLKRPDGAPLGAGDLYRAPGQAEILRRMGREGPSAFYQGEVAEDMVAVLRASGGPHTLEDFAAAAVEDVEPISTVFAGQEVLELPPNGQGAAALLALDILAGFDLASLPPDGADRAHLEAEAVKLAYDARNRFVADPATFPESVSRMRAPGLAERLRARIDPHRAIPRAAIAEIAGAAHRDTVYLAVVDQDGGALSLIVSLFRGFGSGIVTPKFGLVLHNRGSGFTLRPGHPNEAAPGKRPLHTLVPGLLRDPASGRLSGVFGVMGGQYQAAGHARFLTNLLVYGMDPQQALDGPRAFPEPEGLKLERGYADGAFEALHARGQEPCLSPVPIGGGQAILIEHARG